MTKAGVQTFLPVENLLENHDQLELQANNRVDYFATKISKILKSDYITAQLIERFFFSFFHSIENLMTS